MSPGPINRFPRARLASIHHRRRSALAVRPGGGRPPRSPVSTLGVLPRVNAGPGRDQAQLKEAWGLLKALGWDAGGEENWDLLAARIVCTSGSPERGSPPGSNLVGRNPVRNLSKTADPILLFLWAETYGVGRGGAHGTLGES